MTTLNLAVRAAVGAVLLAGCTTGPLAPEPAMAPAGSVWQGARLAEGYYQLGRYYQGQNRLELAADAFRKALAEDPAYAEAHNGLGAVLAMRGELDAAIARFDMAIVLAPRAAHFYSNLGYAYHLQGRPVQAVEALQRAMVLDPEDAWAQANLALASRGLEAAGGVASLPTAPAADATTATGVAKAADVRTAGYVPLPPLSTGQEKAPAQSPASALPQGTGPLATQPSAPASVLENGLVQIAPQIYQLRHATTRAAAPALATTTAPAAAAVMPPAASPAGIAPQALPRPGPAVPPYRLEIANGNGVTGMARRVGGLLLTQGVPKPRLTNERPFKISETVIEYRQGFATAAADLSARLDHPIEAVPARTLRWGVDVRLLLGRDVATGLALVAAPMLALAGDGAASGATKDARQANARPADTRGR